MKKDEKMSIEDMTAYMHCAGEEGFLCRISGYYE